MSTGPMKSESREEQLHRLATLQPETIPAPCASPGRSMSSASYSPGLGSSEAQPLFVSARPATPCTVSPRAEGNAPKGASFHGEYRQDESRVRLAHQRRKEPAFPPRRSSTKVLQHAGYTLTKPPVAATRTRYITGPNMSAALLALAGRGGVKLSQR